ncbi:stage VI sporulation protein D [Bacillus salacetis]|uniref:Stage VI sporulation protein D n=1 Tax=Bacillus salacetis TaxID=2315464 RepID=A0A3A1R5Q6_9BACI|nr:stage VI sporulation protein D [Bacillus salacetis]RIW37717.1 stage VI sporulation protein D [Bacillus salacetis]
MSQEQQSCLRFSLEEAVWFKKGQEVEELLSISLDPHITIQEQEQYVLIRGTLDLTGDYLPSGSPEEDQENWYDFHQNGKYVHRVEYREKGECEFSHSFPVDVTIPKNRIANMDEIDVYVDSFDYVVPENACLKLNADLTISGIYGEQQAHVPYELTEEQVIEPAYRSAPAAEVLQETEEEESLDELEEVYETEREEEETEVETEVYFEEEYEEEEEDTYEPFTVEGRRVPDQEEEVIVPISYEAKQESPPVFSFEAEEFEYARGEQNIEFEEEESAELYQQAENEAASHDEEESSSSPEVEGKKKKSLFKKKTEMISLTDFFARKDDGRAAKMKVCIVQQGETLELIADKYDLSIPQLLRVNHLEAHQDVTEGQVLYIPQEEPAYKN